MAWIFQNQIIQKCGERVQPFSENSLGDKLSIFMQNFFIGEIN